MNKVNFCKNKNGQVALFDGVIFFMIMIILSILMLSFSVLSSHSTETHIREEMTIYTEETMNILMDSSIPDVSYIDKNGQLINRSQGNTQIEYLLLEELGLLDDGIPQENFNSYEENISAQARELIMVQYHFGINATYWNASSGRYNHVYICSNESVSTNYLISFSRNLAMLDPGKFGTVDLKFFLWRIN